MVLLVLSPSDRSDFGKSVIGELTSVCRVFFDTGVGVVVSVLPLGSEGGNCPTLLRGVLPGDFRGRGWSHYNLCLTLDPKNRGLPPLLGSR